MGVHVKLTIASIKPGRTKGKENALESLTTDYLHRAARYLPTEAQVFPSEAALFESLDRLAGRTAPHFILFDSGGELFTSEDLATRLQRLQDVGTQRLVLAIGPADGWSKDSRQHAQSLVSLGRITLPHELARVVLAEQIYRALTILAGHPYHSGH